MSRVFTLVFFLSILLFLGSFLPYSSKADSTTSATFTCNNAKVDKKTCVGVGRTYEEASKNCSDNCVSACELSQSVWCQIICPTRRNCSCSKVNPIPRCTITDKSCVVYTEKGEIDPKKTKGWCVAEGKTVCNALCSNS